MIFTNNNIAKGRTKKYTSLAGKLRLSFTMQETSFDGK